MNIPACAILAFASMSAMASDAEMTVCLEADIGQGKAYGQLTLSNFRPIPTGGYFQIHGAAFVGITPPGVEPLPIKDPFPITGTGTFNDKEAVLHLIMTNDSHDMYGNPTVSVIHERWFIPLPGTPGTEVKWTEHGVYIPGGANIPPGLVHPWGAIDHEWTGRVIECKDAKWVQP